MPFYSRDVLNEVKERNEIVDLISEYVDLRQRGANYVGLCPFHREKTPSFSVSSDRQSYHCFGCGEGGNAISFIMKIENLAFSDAVRQLASRVHYNLPEGNSQKESENHKNKQLIYEIHKKTARFYYELLMGDFGAKGREYLDNRRIAVSARRKFGLGLSLSRQSLTQFLLKDYSSSIVLMSGLVAETKNGLKDRFWDRLMFPIFDISNNIIGFGGRAIEENPIKYINSPETLAFNKSRTLYGLNYARLEKTDTLILVEGYMDVIALYQQGIKNAVAPLGTAFTQDHARILKNYCKKVILLFDSDSAGQKATLRAIEHLGQTPLQISVCSLENAKDPDEFISKYGPKKLLLELDNSQDSINYKINIAKSRYDINKANEKTIFLKEASKIIANLESELEKETYIKQLSSEHSISENAIKQEISINSQNFDINFTQNNIKNIEYSKGIDTAKKSILYAMQKDMELCLKIGEILESNEFQNETYANIFNILLDNSKAGHIVLQSEMLDYFEDLTSRKIVYEVFSLTFEYNDYNQMVLALEQEIRAVKLNYIESLIRMETNIGNIEAISELAKQKKRLNSMNKFI